MNYLSEQQILIMLSNWVQIINFRRSGSQLLVEGYINPGTDPEFILQQFRGVVPKIGYYQVNSRDVFAVRLQSLRHKIPMLNLILLLLTICSTLFAGTLLAGFNPLQDFSLIVKGVPFSITLMLILGVHELGHFLMAKKNRVDASLPYFLPAPTFIGTFGAFIKMRAPVQKRRALVEIGAAGPIAGFLVAVPALFVGLSASKIMTTSATVGLKLGESIMMKIATWIMYPGLSDTMDIMLHPVAFAAWIGMLVTMLNLLPIGQLDGGHIAYALLGKWYKKIGWGALGAILILSIFSTNWLVWAVLVYLLTRMRHPPILDSNSPVTKYEKMLGIITLIIFILTFIPVPFQFQ
jgi:membrane-associated protease RseP (regulator of RpoE activity)